MTGAVPEQIELRHDDPDGLAAVAARMAALAAAGAGWVNLEPEVDPHAHVPPRGLIAVLFSARGPDVPFLTWTAQTERDPASLGVQHGAGPKAAARLELPRGWRVAHDHPRRGLVVLVPPTDAADHRRLLGWLLGAGETLSTAPLTGWWRATIHATTA